MAFIELLGLDDTSDRTTISQKITERHEHFSRLLQTAPTAHLMTIYEKKLRELAEIAQKYGTALPGSMPGGGQSVPQSGTNDDRPAGNGAQRKGGKVSTPMLVLHTEGRRPEYFIIKHGKNLIGRRTVEGFNTIVIEDEYISRLHAVVEHDGLGQMFLYDIGEMQGQKPSTNGVYVNGNENRLPGKAVLRSGDAFQVGYTKLVLTYAETGQCDAEVEKVARTGFVPTVIIKTY